MKVTYFFDGLYSGHHNSYAKNIVSHTSNTVLVINKNKTEIFRGIDENKLLILNCKDAKSYKITVIGWLVNFIFLLTNKRIKKGNVYFLYADSLIPYIFLFSLFFRSKIFITVHWANAVVPIEKYRSQIHKVLRHLKFKLFSILAKKVQIIFVHGDFTKKNIEALYPHAKVLTIPYGIEENFSRKQDLIQKEKVKNNKPKILYFGGMRRDKGVEKLAQLASISPEYHFLIVGHPGEYTKKKILDLFYDLPNVELVLKFVPEEEVKNYFLQSDVLILPYEYYFSGQSGPLTLSTIYRLPVVASNVGDMGHCIQKYNLGIAVENNEPFNLKKGIEEVLSNPSIYYDSQDKFYKNSLWRKVGKKIESYL
ncbi:glycosyltransferase family 4 protein [Bacillus alveayuensis]|uniref:glycosyltransferase family 4 protein n=1 Tax=Aeribacillus alveayuensis TaxID=279215 RepID=UPI0005CD5537|nr:glycosyltransferase family 4 protein [Bacillus alveayuensis]